MIPEVKYGSSLGGRSYFPTGFSGDAGHSVNEVSVAPGSLAIGQVEGIFYAGAEVAAELGGFSVYVPDFFPPNADHLPGCSFGHFINKQGQPL